MRRLRTTINQYGGTVALASVLTVSLAGNVVLLRPHLARGATAAPGIEQDVPMPAIEATDMTGRRRRLNLTGPRPVVVYVLSPFCGWCSRNRGNVSELARQVGDRFEFIGLSTGGTLEDLRSHLNTDPLPFDVLLVDSRVVEMSPVFRATPATIVVRDGLIEAAWVGAYMTERLSEIQQYFGVHLPGVSPTGASTTAR